MDSPKIKPQCLTRKKGREHAKIFGHTARGWILPCCWCDVVKPDKDPEIKCYLPGVPSATYMHLPFQIFHSEKAIFFAYEYAGAVRNIYLDDPGPAPVDSWMGQSWGYWEGNTLVVEASGFNDQTWFDRSGNFHSDQLKVTERYTLINQHIMNYEATIEDDKIFTRPWKISMNLYKRVGKDAQLQQFKCVEFVEELIYGKWRGD